MTSAYEDHLDRNEANYTPLTPLSLIARTAYVYPNKLAVIHADRQCLQSPFGPLCQRPRHRGLVRMIGGRLQARAEPRRTR